MLINGKIISLVQKFRYIYSDRILLLLMFSCSQQIKSPNRRASLVKSVDTSTDMVSQFQGFSELQKKIETKQSFVSEKLKSSIISDNGYNSSIYEWRKIETAPIVKVIELAKKSEIDSFTGMVCTHNTIKPEGIHCRLSNFQQFSKEQMLYILKNMLDGHQAIFKKMKATSVSLEKCVVTPEGEVKVWVNQYLERNDISGQILSREDQITKRIFQTVSFLASQNNEYKLYDFIQYVGASMKKSGKWSFVSLKAMLKSYVDCLRLKFPKNITFKKVFNQKRPVLSSMVEDKNYQMVGRPRQNSFQLCQRNIQSLLNCSRNSDESNNIAFGSMIESQIKNPTHKNINQKSSVLRALSKYSRHTNSISMFRTQEDAILEKSRTNDEGSEENPGHKKLPSINDILVTKIGICSLPQVNCDDEYSNSPSARKQTTDRKALKLVISSQFSLKIVQSLQQPTKPDKLSSISTTNQTSVSGNQFCFAKKIKESHLTINMDDNKENSNKNEEIRTASRDRFKDCKMVTMTEQSKKVIGSCTNWENQPSPFNLSNIIQEVRTSRIEQTPTSNQNEKPQISEISSNMEIERQVVSFKNIGEPKSKPITPVKSTKQILKQYLNNPLSLLNELRSEEELQSYENTEKNSSSCGQSPHSSVRKIRVPIQEKILSLLQRNRNLVVSTYMETNSERKIKQEETPEKQRQRKLKDFEQTLSELVRANLKQEEILEGNSWTKKLENLLGMDQELKESISFGVEEANALLRELKLSKLDKCGRHIGNSQFPEFVSQ